jgi:hypothetical protein
MEFLRYQKSVWGEKLLIGVSWDFLWVPFAAAACVIAVHLMLRTRQRRVRRINH